MVLKKCRHCGTYFKTSDLMQDYCTDLCKSLARQRKRRMNKAARDGEKAAAEYIAERIQHDENGEYRLYCLYCLRMHWSKDPNSLFCSEACEKIYLMR